MFRMVGLHAGNTASGFGEGEDMARTYRLRWVQLRRLAARAVALISLILLLGFPAEGLAQSQFAGVYTGTFSSACDPDDGQFAALVKTDGTALFLDYDPLDEEGGLNQGVNVNPDGSFTFTDIEPGFTTVVTGTFTATGVSGNYTVNGVCAGTFSGTKRPTTGFLAEAGGFYTGSLSGSVTDGGTFLGTVSGPISIIAAADGEAFAFARASGVIAGQLEEFESGGRFTIASNGSISATLLDGTVITGNLNFLAHTASGDFSSTEDGVVTSGTWMVTRQLPLPVPPNIAPVAVNDAYEVLANRTLTVGSAEGVLANDSDAEGDTLSAVLASTAPNGTLTLNSNGGFTYTPDRGFTGADSFTYKSSDGGLESNVATVTITVEPISMPWLELLLLDD